MSDESNYEELDNIIVLNDENGDEVEFEFVDLIEHKGKSYVVLLPVLDDDEEDDGEVVILEVQDGENEDEEAYVSIDDEEILQEVFEIFKDKYEDEFDFTD